MRTIPIFLALTCCALGSRPATAGRIGKCEKLKPEQALPLEKQVAVDTTLRANIPGLPSVAVDNDVDTKTSFEVTLLDGDALARAWTTYQLCVLVENGTISQQIHEEAMRSILGLEPAEAPKQSPESALPSEATAWWEDVSEYLDGYPSRKGMSVICDASERCRKCTGASPEIRGVLIARHIEDKGIKDTAAQKIWDTVPYVPLAAKHLVLAAAAEGAGLDSCALAEEMAGSIAASVEVQPIVSVSVKQNGIYVAGRPTMPLDRFTPASGDLVGGRLLSPLYDELLEVSVFYRLLEERYGDSQRQGQVTVSAEAGVPPELLGHVQYAATQAGLRCVGSAF